VIEKPQGNSGNGFAPGLPLWRSAQELGVWSAWRLRTGHPLWRARGTGHVLFRRWI